MEERLRLGAAPGPGRNLGWGMVTGAGGGSEGEDKVERPGIRSGGWGATISGDPDSHQGRGRRGTPGFRIKDLAENNCFLPNTQN